MMENSKRNESCGFYIENCDDIQLKGNKIKGYDKGIIAKSSTNITAESNEIVLNQSNIDLIKEELFVEINEKFEDIKKKEKNFAKKEQLIDFLSNTLSGIVSSIISTKI